MSADRTDRDALTELTAQNKLIVEMLDLWRTKTTQLEERDSVPDRWERGSAVKLLLQHLAVRETAKQDIDARLREIDEPALADRLEGDGVDRRKAIRGLDEAARGRQAINLNYAEADRRVADLDRVIRGERQNEEGELLSRIGEALGQPGQRGLPGVRSVQMRSDTHPRPIPKWYDRIKPVKALVAFYAHLRSAPSGVGGPNVDRSREHVPGPRA